LLRAESFVSYRLSGNKVPHQRWIDRGNLGARLVDVEREKPLARGLTLAVLHLALVEKNRSVQPAFRIGESRSSLESRGQFPLDPFERRLEEWMSECDELRVRVSERNLLVERRFRIPLEGGSIASPEIVFL